MVWTSVTVTPEAQKTYIEKNPAAAKKAKPLTDATPMADTSSSKKTATTSKKRTAKDAELTDPPIAAVTPTAKKVKL